GTRAGVGGDVVVGEVGGDDAPGALVLDAIVVDGVGLAARDLDAGADGRLAGDAGARHVRIVVVVHVVVLDEGAGGARPIRAEAVLRRRLVVVVERVREDADFVAVPLRVLDDQMTSGVRARIAERAV